MVIESPCCTGTYSGHVQVTSKCVGSDFKSLYLICMIAGSTNAVILQVTNIWGGIKRENSRRIRLLLLAVVPTMSVRLAKTENAIPAPGNCSVARASRAPSDAVGGGFAAPIGEVYERCRNRILSLALRITRNQQDAEDVVQDCFMQAHLHSDSFAGRASLSTWIWRVAINAALMKIRKRRRYEFLFEEVIETRSARRPPEVESREPTPEQRVLQRELQQFLARGLAELNPALSRVVELHYFEELTAQDCARALGISLSNAKARILRAKLRLRSTFNRHSRRRTTAFRPSCYPSTHFGPPSTIVAAALGRWAEQVEKRRR